MVGEPSHMKQLSLFHVCKIGLKGQWREMIVLPVFSRFSDAKKVINIFLGGRKLAHGKCLSPYYRYALIFIKRIRRL